MNDSKLDTLKETLRLLREKYRGPEIDSFFVDIEALIDNIGYTEKYRTVVRLRDELLECKGYLVQLQEAVRQHNGDGK